MHIFSEIILWLRNLNTWPFSVHAEHPLNRPTSSAPAKALGWRFYNSKSSIPNGSASPFRKSTSRPLSLVLYDSTKILFFVIMTARRSPQSFSSYSWQGNQTRWGSPRSLGSIQPRSIRPVSSLQNRIKPCRITPDNKPIQNNNANCSELTLLEKNCKDSRAYAVSSWNRIFVDSRTKLHKVSGTSNIIQKKLRIGLNTLNAWPRPSVVKVVVDTIQSRI